MSKFDDDEDARLGVPRVKRRKPTRKQLSAMNRRRSKLTDLLSALEQVRAFVDEHNEAGRVEMLDQLHCYAAIAADELVHVCKTGEAMSIAAGYQPTQWRHMCDPWDDNELPF